MIPIKIHTFYLLFTLGLFLGSSDLFAQTTGRSEYFFSKIDNYNKKFPSEKVYLHTDKELYTNADTLWFKSYLFSGPNASYSKISGIMYAELISDSAQVIRRISLPVSVGLAIGQFILNPDDFPEGFYTLRAYTNWMQNLGLEAFFEKKVYISNIRKAHLLIKSRFKLAQNQHTQALMLSVNVQDPNHKAYDLKQLNWHLMEGNTKVFSAVSQTGTNGFFETQAQITLKSKSLYSLILEDELNRYQSIKIPVSIDNLPDPDLQFMPEGGYLVAEIPNKIAFKALGTDGLGLAVEGKILDSKGKEITAFKSGYKGMGFFNLSPAADESYTAQVTFGTDLVKTYPLPKSKDAGTVLQVFPMRGADSVLVTVAFSEKILNADSYTLIGLVNQEPYYVSSFKATANKKQIKIPIELFPSGIAHLVLLNKDNAPLNERSFFINHKDQLNIQVKNAKSTYYTRDSIPLSFEVKTREGKPVIGSFSVSVTDKQITRTDTTAGNIVSHILLNSGLKGHVETPSYYLSDQEEAKTAVDLLLLTQGWVGYNWKQIFDPERRVLFKAEPELQVSGKVVNLLNKPVAGAKLLLVTSGRYEIIRDTIADLNGEFSFGKFPAVDSLTFMVNAKNSGNKKFGLGLELNRFKPANVQIEPLYFTSPWYHHHLAEENNAVYEPTLLDPTLKNVLNTVVVTGKKIVKHSKNLNGPGGADQIFDAAQLNREPNVQLTDFLVRNIKGFRVLQKENKVNYYLFENEVRFFVDGLFIENFIDDSPSTAFEIFQSIKDKLNALTGITGVEVMYSSRYSNTYVVNQGLKSNKFAYIEITTRSGYGLFAREKANFGSYTPVPLTIPLAFYSPKYSPLNIKNNTPDTRSTVFWKPDIISTKDGVFGISFFAADRPGIYTITIEGSNMDGLIGSKSMEIGIAQRPYH